MPVDGGRGENSTREFCERCGWRLPIDEPCTCPSPAAVPDVTALAQWVVEHNAPQDQSPLSKLARGYLALLALVEQKDAEIKRLRGDDA